MKRTLLHYSALGVVLLLLGGCADRSVTQKRRPAYYANTDIAPVSATSQGPHPNLERWHP